MKIIWHGDLCFTIKGKKATVVIDPYEEGNHKLKKVNADTVLLTNDYDDKAKLISGAEDILKINWPGEFEVNEVAIVAIAAYTNEKEEGDTAKGRIVIYSFMIDDIRICHLGLAGEEIDDEMLEKIGDVDVLILPAAGKVCFDAKKAHDAIEKIEPKVVIPMNYKDNEIEPMLKEMGISDPQELDEYEIKLKSQLPEDKTELILLNVSP